MKALTLAMALLLVANAADARPVALWPYEKLAQESDLVAVVEVDSIGDTDDTLLGYGEPQRYQGKSARLKVGWVIKGKPTETVDMLYFIYSLDGLVEPNGAQFISFREPEQHQYLIFLKRDGERLVPVTGHYDGAISVKVMRKDSLSPIE